MIGDVMLYIAGVLVLAGAVFGLLAAVGIVRFPDLYTRMHAASKAGVVGAGLAMLAVAVESAEWPIVLRALAGIAFLLLTTPISAHLLAKSAYFSGYKPKSNTNVDESFGEP